MGIVVDGGALRSLRESRGWNRKTLAMAAGIDPSVISRLERGLQSDLRASVLVALARALSVPVDALIADRQRDQPSDLVPELTSLIAELGNVSEAEQRQLATILRGYLSARTMRE